MRVNELIGATVEDVDGSTRHHVIDVRARAEQGGLVVDGLVIGRHHWRMFGYEHRRENGPFLLSWMIKTLHRDTRYVPWGDFELDGRTILLRREWKDFPHLPGLSS